MPKKRMKLKLTPKKGKPPTKMARGGTVAAPTKGPIYDGLLKPAKDSHDGTVKMIGGIRSAKNKMPKRIRDAFPDF